MKRALVLALLAGCSAPYEIKLVDGTSVSQGALALIGYAVPAMAPGLPLADARPGQRLVLWAEEDFEAIIDLGDVAAVLVREKEHARPPTTDEIRRLALLFPRFQLVPSQDGARYDDERARATAGRAARLFPSDIVVLFDKLPPTESIDLALENRPEGWMERGGRIRTLINAAATCAAPDLSRILRQAALERFVKDRKQLVNAVLARKEVPAAALAEFVRSVGTSAERAVAEDLIAALKHPVADESVHVSAIESIEKHAMSSLRRNVLETIAALPAVSAVVLRRMVAVEMDYDEDRFAVIQAIARCPGATPELGEALRKAASRIRDSALRNEAEKAIR